MKGAMRPFLLNYHFSPIV